jgi:small subunit ribosomal protein S6
VTHQYELMVILDPEIDERTVAPSLDKFLNVIRTDGGTIDNVDIWGRRRLAYEINKKSEGIYAVVNFTANSSATVELDRQLKLSEAVMRTKVLRAEEGMAQVAAAKKLAEEKAARKAASPAKASVAAPTEKAPTEKAPAEKAPVAEKAVVEAADAPVDVVVADAPAKPAAKKPVAKADKDAE